MCACPSEQPGLQDWHCSKAWLWLFFLPLKSILGFWTSKGFSHVCTGRVATGGQKQDHLWLLHPWLIPDLKGQKKKLRVILGLEWVGNNFCNISDVSFHMKAVVVREHCWSLSSSFTPLQWRWQVLPDGDVRRPFQGFHPLPVTFLWGTSGLLWGLCLVWGGFSVVQCYQ